MTIMSDTLTVTRYSAQTRDAFGRASVKASASTFTILASVQRPGGRTLDKLQEGHGTRDAWYVDTVTTLQTEDELAGTPADTLVIDGNTYEVHEDIGERAVLIHGEYLVKRVESGLQP